MKLCIVLGTRPEIIKGCSLIRACEQQKTDYFVIHTGQHYSYMMDQVFFEELHLPKPRYNLHIGSSSHGEQTGMLLQEIEKVLIAEKPTLVLVIGDTNSVLAGALAATKLRIKVAHIESGLRSYDRDMAEEQNRIVVDHLSDYLFAPTQNAASILINEGIAKERVFVVGNPVVDAVHQNIQLAENNVTLLKTMGLEKGKYIVATAHRPENVDNNIRLSKIILGLNKVNQTVQMPIVFSIHPRTKKRVTEFNIAIDRGIRVIEPVGYLAFLHLLANAQLTITDSGGIQEETSILKIPCVTIRDNTERPETLTIRSNTLAGVEPEAILQGTLEMMVSKRDWQTPYGNGRSAESILAVLIDKFK